MRGDNDAHSSAGSLRPTNGSGPSPMRKAALSNVLNGSTNGSAANGSSSVHSRLDAGADKFFGHDREEVTRILIQGLNDLGYHGAANSLTQESGYELETSHAAAFRLSIVEGHWAEAEALVLGNVSPQHPPDQTRTTQTLALADGACREEMLFQIRQQKYLELLELRDLSQALMVLRQELQPLRQNERALHALSSLIMCQSADDLKYQARWDGASGQSRKELFLSLSKSISPSAMIPEHRLADLLTQVKESQVSHCLYHNSPNWPSLYMDHHCNEREFPRDAVATLDHHTDEVWYLAFSNDGTRLATASKDNTARIYDTEMFNLVRTLSGHSKCVTYIAWNPTDTRLITCSQDRQFKIWDTSNGRSVRTVQQGEYPVTTAAWAPDGNSFVTGSQDLACPMAIWNADDTSLVPVYNFERSVLRVLDCALSAVKPPSSLAATAPESDSTEYPVRLVAICSSKTVHVFDWARREKLCQLRIEQDLTSISISPDGLEMLVNLGNSKEIWALNVETCEIVQKYRGQAQGQFVIRSAYGGATAGFVVSGGEDSRITVWHRHTARLLEQFHAHGAGCVNAVAWNLARPEMFASVGDDRKVRVYVRPDALLSQSAAASSSASSSGSSSSSGTGSSSARRSLYEERRSTESALPSWGAHPIS